MIWFFVIFVTVVTLLLECKKDGVGEWLCRQRSNLAAGTADEEGLER